MGREAWCAGIHGVARVGHHWVTKLNWTELILWSQWPNKNIKEEYNKTDINLEIYSSKRYSRIANSKSSNRLHFFEDYTYEFVWNIPNITKQIEISPT